MATTSDWYEWKLARRLWTLRAPRQVTEEWKKMTARGHYAKITLAAYPADAFSFEGDHAWSTADDRQQYEPYVLDGILDELMVGPAEPVLGVRFVLENAVTHEVESNGSSFYHAARLATQKIRSSGRDYRDNTYLVDG